MFVESSCSVSKIRKFYDLINFFYYKKKQKLLITGKWILSDGLIIVIWLITDELFIVLISLEKLNFWEAWSILALIIDFGVKTNGFTMSSWFLCSTISNILLSIVI